MTQLLTSKQLIPIHMGREYPYVAIIQFNPNNFLKIRKIILSNYQIIKSPFNEQNLSILFNNFLKFDKIEFYIDNLDVPIFFKCFKSFPNCSLSIYEPIGTLYFFENITNYFSIFSNQDEDYFRFLIIFNKS